MNVLVAGGAGFIGSHLCDIHIGRGDFVTCLDNLSTGSKHNISHLMNSNKFVFVHDDITNNIEVQTTFDTIYNFASPASPPQYMRLSIETLLAGSIGTFNLLELAKAHGARFVMASTSEVYGDPIESPQKESYWGNVNPVGKRSCYDEAKRFSEAMCISHAERFGTNVGIVRIFNTYGPRLASGDGRAVPNFLKSAITGEPIVIHGDGEQTRSFCYVDDLVDGIVKFAESRVLGPMNIGNNEEIKIIDLAKMILQISGGQSPIVISEPAHDDPRKRKPDIDMAKKLIDWAPSIPLSEGLRATYLWMCKSF